MQHERLAIVDLPMDLDLSVLKLDELLLTAIHQATEASQHDVPGLENKG